MVSDTNKAIVALIEATNIDSLIRENSNKLSIEDICERFGLDIKNDKRNKFFWNTNLTNSVLINEDLLNWAGYAGGYKHQNLNITKLLKRNKQIEFGQIKDEHNPRKRYYVVNTLDFDSLLMQMRTKKAIEIRELFSIIKHVFLKYTEYERNYELRLKELWNYEYHKISEQNNQIMCRINEFKNALTLEREKFSAERKFTLERARRAEEARQRAETECRSALRREANVQHSHQALQRMVTHMEEKIVYTKSVLVHNVAPLLSPKPINNKKIRSLGLYRIDLSSWYMIRRQEESYRDGERNLLEKYPGTILVRKWTNVPHAIDVANTLKTKFKTIKSIRGNILKSDSITDNHLVNAIEESLNDNEFNFSSLSCACRKSFVHKHSTHAVVCVRVHHGAKT